MCGYSGFISFIDPVTAQDAEAIKACAQQLDYRGPDHSAQLTQGKLTVVHHRLSVIDLEARSNQPFISSDQRYSLTYNGEIYNFRELRQELKKQGISFRTASDTEVLLEMLIAHGEAALSQLNGCFSFLFYDHQKEEALLARDRMGIKPLHYALHSNGIAFSSEFKGLMLAEGTRPDKDRVVDFLRFTYLPDHRGWCHNTFRLLPGELLRVGAQVTKHQWFDHRATFNMTVDRDASLATILESAVSDRLIADVPLGSFLSGGIDSSIIAALAAKKHSRLHTFSLGIKEFPHLDEGDYAEAISKHIGSHHHRFDVSTFELASEAKRVLRRTDEPFADASAIAVSFLAHQTRQEVTVALSGDGADELFGGYRKHRAHALASTLPGLAGKFLIEKSGSRERKSEDRQRQLARFKLLLQTKPELRIPFLAAFHHHEVLSELIPGTVAGLNTFTEDQLLYDQLQVLPFDMLTKVDAMSMQHALEVRVPFLDHRVVAYANALPQNKKYGLRRGKIPLREAFNDLLPQEVFARRKQGFEVPLASLIRAHFSDELLQLKASERLSNLGINMGFTKILIDEHQTGAADHASIIWCLLVLDQSLGNLQRQLKR